MTIRQHVPEWDHNVQSSHRQRRSLLVLCMIASMALACSLAAIASVQAEVIQNVTERVVSIPVSNLDLDQATATISVLQEPSSPIHGLLRACQKDLPEILPTEDHEIIEEMQALCRKAERWTQPHMPPVHSLDTTGYSLRIPLKTPYRGIKAIVWRAKNLDDVITFMNLLRGGALHSVRAFTALPWAEDPAQPCTECPIKELVFRALEIEKQGSGGALLEKNEEEAAGQLEQND